MNSLDLAMSIFRRISFFFGCFSPLLSHGHTVSPLPSFPLCVPYTTSSKYSLTLYPFSIFPSISVTCCSVSSGLRVPPEGASVSLAPSCDPGASACFRSRGFPRPSFLFAGPFPPPKKLFRFGRFPRDLERFFLIRGSSSYVRSRSSFSRASIAASRSKL